MPATTRAGSAHRGHEGAGETRQVEPSLPTWPVSHPRLRPHSGQPPGSWHASAVTRVTGEGTSEVRPRVYYEGAEGLPSTSVREGARPVPLRSPRRAEGRRSRALDLERLLPLRLQWLRGTLHSWAGRRLHLR